MSVCNLFPGYGRGTLYTWGMGNGEAGFLARKAFLTLFHKYIDDMAVPCPKNIVLKMSVSRKYYFLMRLRSHVLVFYVFQVRGKRILSFF